ncbi:thermonuclease family protein [Vogesella oryzae]|uniref:thermonuclease family protein n=1 Tax=Vogesella oryzae TaxID=1735285 RepID=UPI00158335E1|nr:thermonuclease family protein [Vogesella oryzae]
MSRFSCWHCLLLCLLSAAPALARAEGLLTSFYCVVQAVESGNAFSCVRYRQLPDSEEVEQSRVRVSLLAFQPPPDNHPLAAASYTQLDNILLYQQVRVDVFGVDKVGRDLARVRLYKADITAALLSRGLGSVDRSQYGAYYYVPFEREARNEGLGIWAQSDPL